MAHREGSPLPAAITLGRLLIALSTLVALAACSGDSASEPLPSPSPTIAPVPAVTVTDTPTPPPEPSAFRFVYREPGQDADVIWRVNPADPSQREQLARVNHPPGRGISATLSADGKSMLYTLMPPGALDPTGQADAYTLVFATGKTEQIAQRVDLRTRPLPSPDGQLVYFRGNDRQDVLIIQIDLSRPKEDPERDKEIIRVNQATFVSLLPIGFSKEDVQNVGNEKMYLIQVRGGTQGGTSVASYVPVSLAAISATATALAPPPPEAPPPEPPPPEEPPPEPPPSPTQPPPATTFIVQISDQNARDCRLSPDAKKVACVAPALVEGQILTQTVIADLVRKSTAPLPGEGLGGSGQLRPAWHPDGDKVSVGQLPSGPTGASVAIVQLGGGQPTLLTPPPRGFDVPLSWAPDGRFLAVTSYEGDSVANPGLPRLVFLSPGGQRVIAAEGVEADPLGWVEAD